VYNELDYLGLKLRIGEKNFQSEVCNFVRLVLAPREDCAQQLQPEAEKKD